MIQARKLVVSLCVLGGIVSLVIGIYALFVKDTQTIYAAGFVESAFDSVWPNDDGAKLEELLGKPLLKHVLDERWPSEAYRYPAANVIVYTRCGLVLAVAKPQKSAVPICAGNSAADVTRVLGSPSEIVELQIEFWEYSLPSARGGGSYWRRTVAVDRKSFRVLYTISELYHD